MFVFSNAQFQRLMGVTDPWKVSRLLDLGAGDGKVTSVIAQHFDEVYATEQSPSMRWRLGSRGFKYVLLWKVCLIRSYIFSWAWKSQRS